MNKIFSIDFITFLKDRFTLKNWIQRNDTLEFIFQNWDMYFNDFFFFYSLFHDIAKLVVFCYISYYIYKFLAPIRFDLMIEREFRKYYHRPLGVSRKIFPICYFVINYLLLDAILGYPVQQLLLLFPFTEGLLLIFNVIAECYYLYICLILGFKVFTFRPRKRFHKTFYVVTYLEFLLWSDIFMSILVSDDSTFVQDFIEEEFVGDYALGVVLVFFLVWWLLLDM